MRYKTFSGTTYSGGTITRGGERSVYCKISVDIHEKSTLLQTATERVYIDALLSGAGKYTREEFTDAVETLGASISVTIHNSILNITLTSSEKNISKLMKLFELMVCKPSFRREEITRIQRQVQNELSEYKENAKGIAYDNFVNELYGREDRRFTYAPEKISSEIKKITNKTVVELHKKVLTTHWVITIGSSVAASQKIVSTIKLCKENSKLSKTKHAHLQKAQKTKILLQNIPSKQNIEFSIGTSIPITLHHPDYLPFVFGLSVLGKWGGFTGRLMSTVREKEGLTYGIYAKTETVTGNEQGHWRIMTFFAPDHAVRGLKSTFREIKKIQKDGITNDELSRFKTILNTQQIMLSDTLTGSVNQLHAYLCEGFGLKEMKEHQQRLLSVTKKEVNRVLKKYLRAENLVISGAGPISSVKKDLYSFQIK